MLALPWRNDYNNGYLYMTLNTNEFYDVVIPTGFKVANKTQTIDKVDRIINWKKEKIPINLLYEFIEYASYIYNTHKSEFAAGIFYNIDLKEYALLIPRQNISGASVTYDPTNGYIEDMDNWVQLVDLHSHHIMNIGFSSTDDDSDELLGICGNISLVVKKIDRFNWLDFKNNIEMRFTIQDNSYNIDLSDVFEVYNNTVMVDILDKLVIGKSSNEEDEKSIKKCYMPFLSQKEIDNVFDTITNSI